MAEYAYPDVLVSTAWVAEHRHDHTSVSWNRMRIFYCTTSDTSPAPLRSIGRASCSIRWCATTSTKTPSASSSAARV